MRIKVFIFTALLCISNGIFGLPQSKISYQDDSDTWLKPDELPPQYSVVKSESRVVRQYQPSRNLHVEVHRGFIPMTIPPSYSTISRSESIEPQVIVKASSSHDFQNPTTAEQSFYPSYYRSSRPPTSSSPAASIAGRYNTGKTQNFDKSILGSGDFSVIRGGTFYPEGENSVRIKGADDFFSSFLNGHGRPNAQPQTARKEAYYPEDPFENFKDFADLNSGNDPAGSHFIVVYANKNSTKPHSSHPSPKNIFEQLQLLDLDQESENENLVTPENPDEKEFNERKLMKLSKYKSKLAKTKVVKKYKKKLGPKYDQITDYSDPLIAMS